MGPGQVGWSVAMAGLALATACSTAGVSSSPAPVGEDGDAVRALVTPTGVVAAVVGGGPGAWEVRTPCGGTARVTGGQPITEAMVVLDPGHGGDEAGATSAGGVAEKDVNLAVADYVKRALEAEGMAVALTRSRDYRMTIAARTAIVAGLEPAAVVSVHHNGGPSGHNSDRPGTETYYQRGSSESRRLAGLVYEETVASFGRHHGVTWHATGNPGAKYQLNDEGHDYFGMLRRTAGVPVVLSEGLFLSSSESEARLLARADVQRGEGEAIARAIRRFLRTDEPGSGYVESMPRSHDGDESGGPQGCNDPALE